jgi:hypothetical protein
MIRKALILAFCLSGFSNAGDIVVNQFSGLDTADNPASLSPDKSQDLLNVRLQPGGASVFKRDGYGLFQTLTYSTSPVHGGYHFQQTGAADVQLWGSDNALNGSINDAPFVRIATGTFGATWQCTDNFGYAYCLTNAGNDPPVKTDGSLAGTSYQLGIPSGTIITSTPLQLVVAGVSPNYNTIYFSANNNFLNFTPGPLATDPYQEIINAPGSRITHLGYYFGKVFWWKDQSFGYISGSSNQNNVSITIVSNQVGTLDNSSAFWNPTNYEGANKFSQGTQTTSPGNPYFNEASSLGGIFFRGQDNHIYQYDGYTLTRLSRIITPTVGSAAKKKFNSWTQTGQSDFQAGSGIPSGNFTFTSDVFTTSFSVVSVSSYPYISFDSAQIDNNSFETGSFANWTSAGNVVDKVTTATTACGTLSPQDGSNFALLWKWYTLSNPSAKLINTNTGVMISSTSIDFSGCNTTWRLNTISVPSTSIGVLAKLQFISANSADTLTSDSFVINGNTINFYSNPIKFAIDNVSNSPKATKATQTSTVYDTSISSPIVILQSTWTTVGTPPFSLQTSTSTLGVWVTFATSTGTPVMTNRYLRYLSTFTFSSSDLNSTPSIAQQTIVAASTGTYYSAVNYAATLSKNGNFSADDSSLGVSSITYYVRTSTGAFSVLSSTPLWHSQSKNASINYSSGTYMQMRADFNISNPADNLALNDFTFDWTEGSASDKTYITYFQDAIWFAVSTGGTSTNNTIFYLDLINNAWLKDNIPSNGFLVENNSLYLGDPTAGRIFKYGSVTTDNAAAIQSYWKSKDFTGADPTVQNEYQQADFLFNAVLSTATYTYNLDQNVSTTVLLPLYSSSKSIVKRGILLGVGKIGTFYNFSVGDNSSNPAWVLMGHRVKYNGLNWIPETK